jgi:hypothetical protein
MVVNIRDKAIEICTRKRFIISRLLFNYKARGSVVG